MSLTSHTAGVFAADESALGDLAAALGAAGYTIASRLTLQGEDIAESFERWLDHSIEDENLHVLVGTATDATRAATLARITKRVSGFVEIPGIDGGRCKDTIVILVPADGEARATAIAFALPHIERELAGGSADSDQPPAKVSIPDRPANASSAKPAAQRMKDLSGIAKLPPIDKESSVVAKIPPVDKDLSGIAKIPPVDKEPSVVARIPPVDKESSVVAKIPLIARSIPATPPPRSAAIPSIPSTPPPKSAGIPRIPATPPPASASRPATPPPPPSPGSGGIRQIPSTPSPDSGAVPRIASTPSPDSGAIPRIPSTPSPDSGAIPRIPSTPPPASASRPATPPPPPSPGSGAIPRIAATPSPDSGAIPRIPSTPPPGSGAIARVASTPPSTPPQKPAAIPSTPPPKPPVIPGAATAPAPKPPAIPATPPPTVPGNAAGRRTPPPPPAGAPHRLGTEEIEPLSLEDVPEAAGAAPAAAPKSTDAIGRLFERTPAPSELTPIAAKAVIAADKAKADAAAKTKLDAPEPAAAEMFSVGTAPATASSASRSRRTQWIAAAVGVTVVGGAAFLLLGHSSKPAAPVSAKASPKPAPDHDPATDRASEPPPTPAESPPAPPDPAGSAAESSTIELPDDHVAPSTKPTATSPVHAAANPDGSAATKPAAPATAKPAGTAPAPSAGTPTATVEAPVTADGCDKVSCVIDAYARPCCEPFRPRKPGETPRELDRDMILAGMSKAKAAVIHCGEETPSAKGIVKLAMKVAPDGSVADASVAETPDPTLGECVATAIRKVTFAQTEQGGTFNYPFKF